MRVGSTDPDQLPVTMIELSLSETARRHGISKSALSAAVKERRPVKGYDLHEYRVTKGVGENEQTLGFHFPDDYDFPVDPDSEAGKDPVRKHIEQANERSNEQLNASSNDRTNSVRSASDGAEPGESPESGASGEGGTSSRRRKSNGARENSGEALEKAVDVGKEIVRYRPEILTPFVRGGAKIGAGVVAGKVFFDRAPLRERGGEHSFLEDALAIVGAVSLGGVAFLATDYAIEGEESIVAQFFDPDMRNLPVRQDDPQPRRNPQPDDVVTPDPPEDEEPAEQLAKGALGAWDQIRN